MTKTYLVSLALVGSLSAFLPAKAIAQSPQGSNCVNLQEVTTGRTQIRKQIKIGFLGPGNIHTDFSVPSNNSLNYFEVSFVPENDANYDVDVNFRYADGAQATVFFFWRRCHNQSGVCTLVCFTHWGDPVPD
ncbi:MAG: hypothetical protein F6K00_12210 [Leptolyngbya sp. SIOISBB]|nr:hypothetical protein [Leptolyngbya sp. SIOISBB]